MASIQPPAFMLKKERNKWLREQIAALRGTRNQAVLYVRS
jgi:hypothetical protein